MIFGWFKRVEKLERQAEELQRLRYLFEALISNLQSANMRLEADLRELRSTQNAQILARQHEGPGLAALLREEATPEESDEMKRMRDEARVFQTWLNSYEKGDGDTDG